MVQPPGALQGGLARDPGSVHVVHVIARLNDGGPVRVLAALLPELHRHGVRSTVLAGDCSPEEPDRTDWLRAHGVIVERIHGLGRTVRLRDDWAAFRVLFARLRALRPDVVHTHTAKAGFLGRLACRMLGIRCLHTYHGHVLDGYFSHPVTVALTHLERLAASNHHHQALTPTQTLDLARCFRIGRGTTWHSLPVPVPAVKPQPYVDWSTALRRRTPGVGFHGRLVPVKDIDQLLETLAVLSHHRPVQGLICGDGPLREHAEFRAAELQLRVHFTGFIPAGEALAQMDVLLMTSRNEGQPLSAIEAASAGVPVVAPPVGGLDDLARWGAVRGAERTPEALAEAVEQLISDPEQRRARIAAGLRVAARLTPEALAPRYVALYRGLAALVLLVAFAGTSLAAELKALFTAAATGDLLTWEVAAPDPAWLSTDVARTPQLKVTGPDGRVLYRPAFAIGTQSATGLRVRHVARVPGDHAWTLLDPAGATLGSGSFTVGAGAGPAAPLGINPRNRRFLAWADGAPFIPIGPNIAWTEGDPALGYDHAFATLAANGGNHTRVWMCTWSLGIEGTAPDAYRLDRAEQLDGVLAAARAHGVRVTLVLDNHTDVVGGTPFPYGDGIEKRQNAFFADPPGEQWTRRLRYCLARWGADDAIAAWELINEPDLAMPVRERVIPWINGAAEMLQRLDVDHRLHTVSWCGSDWPRALASPAIDIVQLHHYVLEFITESEHVKLPSRDGVGMLIPDAAAGNEGGRPWLLGESGYQGTNAENHGNDRDTGGLLLRQQLWAGFLLGGCGGGMNWWWDTYLDAQRQWGVYKPFAAIAAKLDLTDADLVPITPNASGALRLIGLTSPRQALLMPQMRDDTWFRHLVEGRARPASSIALPIRLSGFVAGRTYRVTTWSTITGAEKGAVDLIADGDGRLTFSLPPGTLDVVWQVALTPAP